MDTDSLETSEALRWSSEELVVSHHKVGNQGTSVHCGIKESRLAFSFPELHFALLMSYFRTH